MADSLKSKRFYPKALAMSAVRAFRGPSNILNVSLHRSGTQSAHDLFLRCGASSIHYADNVDGVNYVLRADDICDDLPLLAELISPVLDRFLCVGDVPIPALYPYLKPSRPKAKFFALPRPPDVWVKSVRTHTHGRLLDPFERPVYSRHFGKGLTDLADLSDRELADFHTWHHDGLVSFFGEGEFLLVALTDPEAGRKLTRFLNLPNKELRLVDYKKGIYPLYPFNRRKPP